MQSELEKAVGESDVEKAVYYLKLLDYVYGITPYDKSYPAQPTLEQAEKEAYAEHKTATITPDEAKALSTVSGSAGSSSTGGSTAANYLPWLLLGGGLIAVFFLLK